MIGMARAHLIELSRPRIRHTRPRGQLGFTLMELLVVLAILGLLMALVGPNVLNRLGKAGLGIPATVMLMSVTDKRASATGNSISGGVGSPEWDEYWSQIDP